MTSDNTSHSRRDRIRLLVSAAVLAGALILLVATEWGAWAGLRTAPVSVLPGADVPSGRENVDTSPASPGITGGPTPVRAFGAAPIPPPVPEGARSPLADQLNDPRRTAKDDVAAVGEIIANYLDVFQQLPVGTNAEITAALAGDNPRAHTPLPADSRAINRAGELVDRWGTPYFFHQISRALMEVRSAGPDQKHFNADDIVWPETTASPVPAGIAQSGE